MFFESVRAGTPGALLFGRADSIIKPNVNGRARRRAPPQLKNPFSGRERNQ